MYKPLLSFFLFLFMLSCEERPEVVFLEPQPSSSRNNSSFPKKVQGRYFNGKDSSLLIISSKDIIATKDYFLKLHRADIDSSTEIDRNDNNSIIVHFKKSGIEALVAGDSIFASFTTRDTLFSISENDKLRSLKGYYFLNTKVNENGYKVVRMTFSDKRHLKFSKMDPSDSLEKFESITPLGKVAMTVAGFPGII